MSLGTSAFTLTNKSPLIGWSAFNGARSSSSVIIVSKQPDLFCHFLSVLCIPAHCLHIMASFRPGMTLARRAAQLTRSAPAWHPQRSMATVVPPVTQDATGSKGPTAMVFMNMGGPSTTDEVGDFLSRLFVRCVVLSHCASTCQAYNRTRLMAI